MNFQIKNKMEEEIEESNISYSNEKYQQGLNKILFSNLSLSDDPIPILIKSPKKTKITIKISDDKNDFKSNLNIIRKKRKKLDIYLLNQNLQNHNSSPEEYNTMLIDHLINLKENHLVSVFKDNLICCNENEYLRGNFNITDCFEVIPKFYDYYKNYLMFFCKPTFNNFYINETIQDYGEKQAEVYYNNNYVTKRQKGKKINIDDKNIEESESDKTSKLINSDNNETSLISFRTFFTNSVESIIKKGIDKKKNSKINSIKKKESKKQELSSIKPNKNDNKDNTIYLPDNSSISLEDIITKKNSIKNIIDLMKNRNINKIKHKKNNELSNHKDKEIKLKKVIAIDKKKLIDGRNLFNKKRFNSFSKTTLNLLDKNKKQKKNINNIVTTNSNNNKEQPNSNYLKYAGVFKQTKYIKINNIPKIKVSPNDLILSPLRNIKPRKQSFNKNSSFRNTYENIYNFNLTTRNQNTNNLKNSKSKNNNNFAKTTKIKLPLKIKNFYKKIKNITNNSNSSIQLSVCKTANNRNNSSKRFITSKNIVNRTNYNFNKNVKYIKKVKVLPLLSPKSKNNSNHNKSLSYSTINNCNININNNIILSNNYIYNNKLLCLHNSQKQITLPNTIKNKSKSKEKNNNKENNIKQNKITKAIPLTSRNIKIDLDKFRTEENFLNSLIHQGASNKVVLRNRNDKSDNNIQYTSFRKASNKDIANNKNRNLFKSKKMISNKSNKNLVLKDVLTSYKSKNNINKNDGNSMNNTYKNIYIKNNNNSNNNQRKLIFEYKKKYM